MLNVQGGCACSAVRYSIATKPIFSFHCQCRQCQRSSGSGHASLFSVTKASVTLTGEVKFHEQLADDGAIVSRGFCPHCGSPIIGKTSGHPDLYLITAASLDDPAQFKPQQVVFHEGAQPWDFVDPTLLTP